MLRKHVPSIYTLAFRLTGNTAEAADLTQDTFQKTPKALFTRPEEAEIRWTLYKNCIRLWKRQLPLWHSLTSVTFNTKASIEEGLRALPPMERAVLILRDSENFSYEKIADCLGCSTETVRRHLSQARQKLSALITLPPPSLSPSGIPSLAPQKELDPDEIAVLPSMGNRWRRETHPI